MEQRSNDAAGMGQSANDATMKDARINPQLEASVVGTGQRLNYAVAKDAQIRFR